MIVKRDLYTPMRDGTMLCMDLYSPDDAPHEVILLRTPYGKHCISGDPLYSDFERYTSAGYHVAVQDTRGTGKSDGELHCNGDNDFPDGYDTVEWIASQPFCNCHVGMFGLSYYGFDQYACAVTQPPHLDVICPFMTQALPPYGASMRETVGCYHLGWVYGQLMRELEKHIPDEKMRNELKPQLEERAANLDKYSFMLPINKNPAAEIPGIYMFEEYLRVVDNVENKDFWHSVGRPLEAEKLPCPVLNATGWFDGQKDTTVDNFQYVRDHGSDIAKNHNALIIGPWNHGGEMTANYDGVDFGKANSGDGQDMKGRMIRWFDHYMKGIDNGVEKDAPVRYYVMCADKWLEDTDWPPTSARQLELFLSENGRLSEIRSSEEHQDKFTYDPDQPMASGFTDSHGHGMIPDWSEKADFPFMVSYETSPLEKTLTVAGTIRLTLYASTDCKDTDFSCRVVDVSPDGSEFELAAGIVRARYRNGNMFEPEFIVPGEQVKYEITVGNTARQLQCGHKIKAYVSSALYPLHDRNLNTDEPIGKGKHPVIAQQTVYSGGNTASCLHIPVIDL